MKIRKLWELSKQERKGLLLRAQPDMKSAMVNAQFIIDRVEAEGDAAVIKWTAEYDRVELTPARLRVGPEEFAQAAALLPARLREAVELAIRNIRTFHERTIPEPLHLVNVGEGMVCGERTTPIDSVCLYVPRGRGSFPSVLCMLGVPARLADAATLYAAAQIGIDEIYRIGGAQAVAAVAFGTETIPACAKIIGPGNVYATAAKLILANRINPGPGAGPSESIILCDETPNPHNVALNLLIEAEHGENSCALLVTHHEPLVQAVDRIVDEQIPQLSELRADYARRVLDGYGGAVLTRSLDESVAFVNDFAPEHLALMLQRPRTTCDRIVNAGEIVMGDYPIISLANYVMGVNAILPTGRWARTQSPVSVRDFVKTSSIVRVEEQAFRQLVDPVTAFSEYEGFCAHHLAVQNWQA
jgi:histidinol dehydrogenase